MRLEMDEDFYEILEIIDCSYFQSLIVNLIYKAKKSKQILKNLNFIKINKTSYKFNLII